MTRRPTLFTAADIKRACKAAPDRVVEIALPDGTVVRFIPDSGTEVGKYKKVEVKKDWKL